MAARKDLGIVVRLAEWSETSQLVSLLTAEHGLVRGLAKGSKRLSPGSIARFSGGFELLTRGEVVFHIKRDGLCTLTGWDLLSGHRHLRERLTAHRLGLYAAEVVLNLLPELDRHPETFAAMGEFLPRLADSDEHAMALLSFQWRILVDAGYRPQLRVDARRGDPLPQQAEYHFDPEAGGFTVASYIPGGGPAGPWRVRHSTLDLLRQIEAEGSAAAPAVEAAALWRANRLLCVYLRYLLDRPLVMEDAVLFGGR